MTDYYSILGVSPTASLTEIKRAYRRLAIQYHPDKNSSPDAAERFYEINEAYDILGDVNKRRGYDALRAGLFDGLTPASPVAPPHRDPAYRGSRPAPPAQTGPPVTYVLMKKYQPVMMWASGVAIAFLAVFLIDFFLPYERVDDRIEQIMAGRRGAKVYYDVITDSGEQLRLDQPPTAAKFPEARIRLWVTPVLGSVIYAGSPHGGYRENVARMYTTHVFFPLLLLLTSTLAFVYRREVEFCFSLNLASLILLMVNLVLI